METTIIMNYIGTLGDMGTHWAVAEWQLSYAVAGIGFTGTEAAYAGSLRSIY